jgi:hypothetical protein
MLVEKSLQVEEHTAQNARSIFASHAWSNKYIFKRSFRLNALCAAKSLVEGGHAVDESY